MTPLAALWLPIVLSAVIVFVASSIMHMLLPYHRSDYQQLPEEDKVLPALRAAGLKPGLYIFPFGSPPFGRLVDEFRRRIIEEAVAADLSGLVFTLVWGVELPGG